MIIVVFRNPLAQNNRQGKKANKKSTCWIWLTSILLHRNRLFPPKSMENSIFRRLHLCHHQNAQNATFADLYHLGPLSSLVSHCQLGQVFACLLDACGLETQFLESMTMSCKPWSSQAKIAAHAHYHCTRSLQGLQGTWNEIWKLLEVLVHIWTMTIRKIDLDFLE